MNSLILTESEYNQEWEIYNDPYCYTLIDRSGVFYIVYGYGEVINDELGVWILGIDLLWIH